MTSNVDVVGVAAYLAILTRFFGAQSPCGLLCSGGSHALFRIRGGACSLALAGLVEVTVIDFVSGYIATIFHDFQQ